MARVISHFDDFFKANYPRMVRYCSSFGFAEADVEEAVADAILKHFDEFAAKIENPNVDTTMRHWMNRRVLLNLKSMYSTKRFQTVSIERADETLHFDEPQAILDVKQRLPVVHPILISYEPFGVREDDGSQARKRGGPKGANTSADKTRFCRERKKFMAAFQGQV